MKKYTVTEIADILDTNPETVRRWIRDDKLTAEQASRKQGNTVTEAALQAFLKDSPKYAARYAAKEIAIPKSVEVVVVPKIKQRGIAERCGIGLKNHRSAIGEAMMVATRDSALTPDRVGGGKAVSKGMEIARLEARMKVLQAEVATLDRTLKSMKADMRAIGIKKK